MFEEENRCLFVDFSTLPNRHHCSSSAGKLDECIAKAFETKTDDLDVNQLEAREYSADDDASLLRFLVDMKVCESERCCYLFSSPVFLMVACVQ